MRLLIITQKVDQHDSVLGFMHHWLEELANHCQQMAVICLELGKYELPSNVKVLSLGKEMGQSRFKYILRFYYYIWRERNNYDAVFVHMNQEYVLLGGVFWRLCNKKVMMWRNHPLGNFMTRIAVMLSHVVFCTSQFSFTARFAKTKIMPAGIDTESFVDYGQQRLPESILVFGRIAPIKKIETIIDAFSQISTKRPGATLTIVGDALPVDIIYLEQLKEMVTSLQLESRVAWLPGVSNTKAVNVYNKYSVYINATPSGSFDKTILEAMASGCLILTSNESWRGSIDDRLIFPQNDSSMLAQKIDELLCLDVIERDERSEHLRKMVDESHSLKQLIKALSAYI